MDVEIHVSAVGLDGIVDDGVEQGVYLVGATRVGGFVR